MNILKIGNRNIVFRHIVVDWDLDIHVILGRRFNYVVDTGLGSLSVMPLKDYINDDRRPVIVINTHYHWDHVWGNGFKYCVSGHNAIFKKNTIETILKHTV